MYRRRNWKVSSRRKKSTFPRILSIFYILHILMSDQHPQAFTCRLAFLFHQCQCYLLSPQQPRWYKWSFPLPSLPGNLSPPSSRILSWVQVQRRRFPTDRAAASTVSPPPLPSPHTLPSLLRPFRHRHPHLSSILSADDDALVLVQILVPVLEILIQHADYRAIICCRWTRTFFSSDIYQLSAPATFNSQCTVPGFFLLVSITTDPTPAKRPIRCTPCIIKNPCAYWK